MRQGVRQLFAAFALLVCGALPLMIPSAASAETLDIEVKTIYAAEHEDAYLDEALEEIAEELLAALEGYTYFELLDHKVMRLDDTQSDGLTLPDADGTRLELSNKSFCEDTGEGGESLLKLGLNLKEKLSTDVCLTPGSIFFQAGLLYKDGILVLAITADRVAP